MRGIPYPYLFSFFILVFIVELVSYWGIFKLLSARSRKTKLIFQLLYLSAFVFITSLLFYSFSNPDTIKQSRSYTLYYFVVAISILNLVPKLFFALMTLISLLISLFGKRLQMLFLSGSLILSASVFLVIVSGVFFTRKNVELRTKDLYFDDLPEQLDGLRIVQISDIHLGTFGHDESVVKKSLSIVQSVKPDLLFFTGDIVNNFADEFMGYESYLSDFQAKYGKFAILGNHDYGDYYQWPDSLLKKSNLAQIKTNIEKCGFQLLLNQSKNIQIKDTSLTLIGVENWGHKPFPQYADLKSAMKNIPEKSFKILMSHDPAHWETVVVPQTNIPLTLSGHTHGGQFALKIAGIEFSPIYFVQKYWGGLYKNDNQFLYVNRGLGTIGFAGRIESNPEVTLLILHRTRIH